MFEKKFLESFSELNVLIVGDVMLDRYWWGSVSRISPEAPVPVVNLENMSLVAGGAANVAANVAGLGAKPFLIGIIGEDEEAGFFSEILKEKNISSDFLVKSSNRRTTIKTRVIAHSQHVVRIDQETKLKLTEREEENIWKRIEKLIDSADVIIVSDYGKGIITENITSRLITIARGKDKFVMVDPKGKNYHKYKGATILTPNRFEVAEVLQLEDYEQSTIENAGQQMLNDYSLDSLLITQGEAGMTLFEKNGKTTHLPVSARNVYDVTGAGDTVIACLATAVGGKATLMKAAKFANQAAGLVVEQMGTTAINLDMLEQASVIEE